jgi:16S rRNA (cytosine967-C5)-methyltransferase
MMLAQVHRLDTPPHAAIATGLELLSGGPRRLAHGVFSALDKRDAALPDAPTLPAEVAARWGAKAAAIAAAIAEPPPLDLSLKDWNETERWTGELDGISLAPGHVRLPRGMAVERLPGFAQGAWWVQDLAASLPARLLGKGGGRRALDLPASTKVSSGSTGWSRTSSGPASVPKSLPPTR